MADERERDIHIRNGAVPPEQLRAAFDALGAGRVVIEDVPGAGREIEIHPRVAALLARLAEGSEGASRGDLQAPQRHALGAPDRPGHSPPAGGHRPGHQRHAGSRSARGCPRRAGRAPLASVGQFGIVAYDPARGAWVQVEGGGGGAGGGGGGGAPPPPPPPPSTRVRPPLPLRRAFPTRMVVAIAVLRSCGFLPILLASLVELAWSCPGGILLGGQLGPERRGWPASAVATRARDAPPMRGGRQN